MKAISSLILSSVLFIGCDDAKQQAESPENGRLLSSSIVKLPAQAALSNHQLKEVEQKFSEGEVLIRSLIHKYQLDKKLIKDFRPLLETLGCDPSGVVVGQTFWDEDNSEEGHWYLDSFHNFDEVVATDKGYFFMDKEGVGKFLSLAGDSKIEGSVEGDVESYAMNGRWKNESENGEMVLIKIDADGENTFGLWTICD